MKASKKMLPLFLLSLLLAVFGPIGCASIKKSITLGMVAGGTGGALSGGLIAQKRRGEAALTMGVIAALMGGASGYFIHRRIEKYGGKVRRETILNLESFSRGGMIPVSGNVPWPSPPKVEEYEIAPKVEGKKLIGGHKVWVIKEAKWPLETEENGGDDKKGVSRD